MGLQPMTFFLAAVAFTAVAAPVLAADLVVAEQVYVPESIVSTYDWSGVNGGYSWAEIVTSGGVAESNSAQQQQ